MHGVWQCPVNQFLPATAPLWPTPAFPPTGITCITSCIEENSFSRSSAGQRAPFQAEGCGKKGTRLAVAQEGMAGGHKEPFFLLQALLGSTLMCFPAALGGSSPFRPNIVLTEEREGGQIQHINCFRIKNKQVSIERQKRLHPSMPASKQVRNAAERLGRDQRGAGSVLSCAPGHRPGQGKPRRAKQAAGVLLGASWVSFEVPSNPKPSTIL